MKSYLKIILICLTVVLSSTFAGYIYNKWKRDVFLSNLQGDIVFTRRDNSNLNIYTIAANGKAEKRIFANSDAFNNNSSFPKWSADKSKINFGAMKDDKWKTFTANSDGGALQISDVEPDMLLSRESLSDDIKVEQGSIYIKESDGSETPAYLFNSLIGYDYKFNAGAGEVSWSPDKQYVVFELCSLFSNCKIMIADRKGENAVILTDGQMPDWK